MDAKFIEQKITEYILANSGLDQHRDYLGISKIGDCPRKAYREYFEGGSFTEENHRMCFTGYEQEGQILNMLATLGLIRLIGNDEKEVVAPFDPRLRGHIDGLTRDGDLLEVKSVSWKRFQSIQENHRALSRHFIQVQLYMLYGRWARAFIVYRCRETYEHVVIHIPFNGNQALKFQQKAARLLECIDKREEPVCECGRCA